MIKPLMRFKAPGLNLGLVFLSVVLVSCAAKLPYSLNYPLSQETFRSHDGTFIGLIPQGWFSASEDSLASAQLAWLVKDDFSAVLTVHELHLDRLAHARVQQKGLKLLANISLAMHSDGSGNVSASVQPAEFSIGGRKFCGYEVKESGGSKRVIVFAVNEKLYESEAVPVKGTWGEQEAEKLFMAQEAFLASLTF